MDLLLQTIISSAVAGAIIGFISIMYKELHTDKREIRGWQRNKLVLVAEEAFELVNGVNSAKAKQEIRAEIVKGSRSCFPGEDFEGIEKLYEEKLDELNIRDISASEKLEIIIRLEKSEFIFDVLGTRKLKDSFINLRRAAGDSEIPSEKVEDYLEKFIRELKFNLAKPPKLWRREKATEVLGSEGPGRTAGSRNI